MSSTESPHNSPLLFIGQQCHAAQCYMVDFLPFRCDHCTHAFCADHYKPSTHACEKYDATKHDRVAPPCPLCSTPVAIPPQQDPNVRMEQHIENECSVTTGRRTKPGSMPICARGKCGKILFAPIKCNSCNKQFCAAHRFPSSHTCATSSSQPAASSSTLATSFSKPSVSTTTSTAGTKLVNQTSAASAAAMAAIKRNMVNMNKPKAGPSKPSAVVPTAASTNVSKAEAGGSASAKRGGAFSKTDRCDSSPIPAPELPTPTSASSSLTPLMIMSASVQRLPSSPTDRDRRAKAEHESRLRAMRERAKKGLLSEREQVLLAEEEAALAAGSGKKDSDCVII